MRKNEENSLENTLSEAPESTNSSSMAFTITLILIVAFTSLAVGWLLRMNWEDAQIERELNGLWLKNMNESRMSEVAHDLDKKGDWVCVNIRGMRYETALKTCNHEVGHEIFAEACEENMDKCLEIMNGE